MLFHPDGTWPKIQKTAHFVSQKTAKA